MPDFTVTVPAPYNNLDSKAMLFDANGNILATSDPANTFNSSLTYYTTDAGTYYLVVASHGASANSTATNVGADIGSYSVSTNIITLSAYAPLRWVYDPRSCITSGHVTIIASANISGTYSLNFTLPAGVTIVAPNAVVVGRNAKLTFTASLTGNVPVQFVMQLRNPLNADLGTYYNSFLSNFFLS